MALSESLRRLYARVPLGMRLGLEPMRAACTRAGNPERAFQVVHVAGTNGKGSVSAMTESIARAGGKKTGLYTSPHLVRFAERIRIGGQPIDDGALDEVLGRALEIGHDLSFFETATLAAFLAFRDAGVELAVLEVGIGGRLDATNVILPPLCAAITSIGFDHMDRLGNTLDAIAREKAGVAKAGTPLVVGRAGVPDEARRAVEEVAAAASARLVHVANYQQDADAFFEGATALPGDYQIANANVAYAIARELGFGEETMKRGFAAARWPGRFELIEKDDGPYLLDGAHNADGGAALAASLHDRAASPIALVFGAMADKAWRDVLKLLAPAAKDVFFVEPAGRAPATLADLQAFFPGGHACGGLTQALARARAAAGPRGRVLVTGSLYLVGEARALLLDLPRDPPVAL